MNLDALPFQNIHSGSSSDTGKMFTVGGVLTTPSRATNRFSPFPPYPKLST